MQDDWFCFDCKPKSKAEQSIPEGERQTDPRSKRAPKKATRAEQPATPEEPKTVPESGGGPKRAKETKREAKAKAVQPSSSEEPTSGRVPRRAAKEGSKAVEMPKTLTRGKYAGYC